MRLAVGLALLGIGCGSGEIAVRPMSVDFGQVDFNEPRPDTGYDPRSIEIENVGGGSLDVVIRDVDEDRVLVGGQFATAEPRTLQPLDAGSAAVITLGVWGYDLGELDTEVTGSIRLTADGLGEDTIVEWSYTPVRADDR